MMIGRNIWSVALLLVKQHGSQASTLVGERITRLTADDADDAAIRSWLAVDQAVRELVRGPDASDSVH